MPLEFNPVTVPFVGGVDTKSASQTVVPTKLLDLKNYHFSTPGSLGKRFGFSRTAAGLPQAGSANTVEAIYPYKDGLLTISGSVLKAGDAATSAWKTLDSAIGWEASQTKVLANAGSQSDIDYGVIGDYSCYVWDDSITGITYQIQDNTTGTVVIRNTLVTTVGATLMQPKILTYDTDFYIFSISVFEGLGRLVYHKISTSSPSTTPGQLIIADNVGCLTNVPLVDSPTRHHGQGRGVVTVTTVLGTQYDVKLEINNGGTEFALYINGQGIDQGPVDVHVPLDLGTIDARLAGVMVSFTGVFQDFDTYFFLTPGTTFSYDVVALLGTGAVPLDIAVAWTEEQYPQLGLLSASWTPLQVDVAAGTAYHIISAITVFTGKFNNTYVAWGDKTNVKAYCSYYQFHEDAPNYFSLIRGAGTAGDVSSGYHAANITGIAGNSGDYVLLYTNPNTTDHMLDHVVKTSVSGGTSFATVELFGCSLASKLYGTFFVARHDSALQPTYYVIDYQSFDISAKFLPGLAGHVSDNCLLTRLVVNVDHFEYVCPYQNRIQSESGQLTTTTGVTKIELRLTLDVPRQSVPLANTIHLAGGNMLMYDGLSAVEHGFHYYPEEVTGTSPQDTPPAISPPSDLTATVYDPTVFGYIGGGPRYYKVTAKNTYGETTPSPSAYISVDTTDCSVLLSWKTVQGAEAYCVFYGGTTGATYEFLGEVQHQTNATTQQFIDDGRYTPGRTAPITNTTGDAVSLPIEPPASTSLVESDPLIAPNMFAAAHPLSNAFNLTMTIGARGIGPAPFHSRYGFVIVANNVDGEDTDSNPSAWGLCVAGFAGAAPVGQNNVQLDHEDDTVLFEWQVPSWMPTSRVTYKIYGGKIRCDQWGTPILDDNGNPTPYYYLPAGSPGNTDAPPPFTGTQANTGGVNGFTLVGTEVTLESATPVFADMMVGKAITISGATSPGNNGVFTVSSVVSSQYLTYENAAAVTEFGNANWHMDAQWGLIASNIPGTATTAGPYVMSDVLTVSDLPTSTDALTGDLPANQYQYWITAVTSAGETSFIETQLANVSQSTGTGQVHLTWNKINNAISYHIYRGVPAPDWTTAGFVASLYNADFVPAMIEWVDTGYRQVTTTLAPAPNWTPTLVKDSTVGLGVLQTGSYGYIVSSLTQFGETIGTPEVVDAAAVSGVGYLVQWTAVPGAAGYAIYGRNEGKEVYLTYVNRGTITYWFDDGTIMGEATRQPQADNTTQLTDKQYQYCVCYEWTDNQGQIHRSAPSVPFTQGRIGAVDEGNTTTVVVPTLTLTNKTYVQIVVYRTSVNGTVFYRVGAVPNDTQLDTVTFIDTSSDGEIIGNEQLYTNGNVLANMEPGSNLYPILHQSRVFVVDALDRRVIWYSKQVIPGQPVEFSDFLQIVTEEQGGDVTGMASMDAKLIVFRKQQISISNSLGLDNLGNGDNFNDLSKLPGDTGCSDPASIVSTNQGVFFRSERGIYMLDRSLQLRYVGAGVEKYLTYDLGAVFATTTEEFRVSTTFELPGATTFPSGFPNSGEVMIVDTVNGATAILHYLSYEYDTINDVFIFHLMGVVPAEFTSAFTVASFNWSGSDHVVVSSAVAMPDLHQVRFSVLNFPLILVYDWLVDQWSTFNPPFTVHMACLYQGKYTFISKDGYVYQEVPGSFQDAGDASSWISLGLTSAWVKLSGITNAQRCRLAQLLGTRGEQNFFLAVQFQADYKQLDHPVTVIDTADWESARGMPTTPLQARIQPTGEIQKSEAIQVIITDYVTNLDAVATDQGLTLTGMTLEVGQKRGQQKHGHNY